MKDKKVFDLGTSLATLVMEPGGTRHDTLLFTAFVNGISLRSNTLDLPAVRDRFIDCVWRMSGLDKYENPPGDTTTSMSAWIDAHVANMIRQQQQ